MELKVNAAEWNGLSPDERARIESIIGGFFKGATITLDPAAPRSAQPAGAHVAGWNPFCKAACDIAEGAAIAACASLVNPIAIAACIAAAHAAGDACRNSC